MAKGPGSENALQRRTAQIASKGTAREVYLKAISEDRRFRLLPSSGETLTIVWGAAPEGRGHLRCRTPQSQEGEGAMRFIVAVLALLASDAALAQVQNRDLSGFNGPQHWTVGDRQQWPHHVL